MVKSVTRPSEGGRSTDPGSGRGGGGPRPAVCVDHVDIVYPGASGPFVAVEDVSFDIQPHERFVIIGPSGCGKTTLLMAIAGFVTPTRGDVLVGGKPRATPGPDRAVVFQDFDQLFPWRTVLGNLVYALKVTKKAKGEAAVRQAREHLDLVNIGHAADKHPHQLSGGMKQRAAIARALALRPSMLLMDEPFGALDAITRTELQRELHSISLKTDVTIVMVTHSIQEAVFLGDRVLVMAAHPGRIRAIVDTSEAEELGGPAFDQKAQQLRDLLVPESADGTPGPGATSHRVGE
jgi:NitT/TauT family transport system ATP-binding protein